MSLALDQLPDDVLVMAMQYLSVDDLFACRLVCMRLNGLALHRDVWRHQKIPVSRRKCVCAVLQLAPCAGLIVYISKPRCSMLPMTRCAAAGLRLCVGEGAFNAAECALALRNQELLGRLRRVQVKYFGPTCQTSAELLLRTLAGCSGLEELDVSSWFELPSAVVFSRTRFPTPTLKYFRCQLTKVLESFVHTVLAGHAATLEEVHLIEYHSINHIAVGTAELLAAMPKLQKLTCDALSGMKAVARCATLREVTLLLTEYADHHYNDAVVKSFLQEATQLRSISLVLSSLVANQDWYRSELINSLAAAPRPLLEHLSIDPLPGVGPLLSALPRLPGLRRLEVTSYSEYSGEDSGVFDDELLLGITPATAPSLRLLQLTQDDKDRCEHAWMHGDAIETVLRVNPALHILLENPYLCELDDCEACTRGCHKEIFASACVGLCSHYPDQCPSLEDHPTDTNVRWAYVPINSV